MVAPGKTVWISNRAQCDVAGTYDTGDNDYLNISHTTIRKSVWTRVKRATRLVRRIIKLFFTLSPIVALYPLHYLLTMVHPLPKTDEETETDDAHEKALACLTNSSGNIGWYYRLCLYCVECSGAAAIKMMQWAGSRPDMFGSTFCRVFSQLQDDTTPHAWTHTVQSLVTAYGDNWHESLQLSNILGSGCIAQVYKGKIEHNGNELLVAIKVKHPNVDDEIDSDLFSSVSHSMRSEIYDG
jgi:predicted unusual protein kinase regulating ubiquinone biosynthesis (AarF/ABC1/UbiB family)